MKVGQQVLGWPLRIARVEKRIEHSIGIMGPEHDVLGVNLDAGSIGQEVRSGLVNIQKIDPTKLHGPLLYNHILRSVLQPLTALPERATDTTNA